ncbi:MAG TPA: hypothetical protein VFJ97_11240 [Dermatophilaceae bacterium]|nr:hypothetical protein [Dermatophilaceae bacterium]
MANEHSGRNSSRRLRLALAAGAATVVAAGVTLTAVVLPASSSDERVKAAAPGPQGAVPARSAKEPPPYSTGGVSLSDVTFTVSEGRDAVSGSFVVANQSDRGVDVTVASQAITLQYRTSKAGRYSDLPDPVCTFTPEAPYDIAWNESQSVSFTCSLAEPVPADAQFLKVTAHVQIEGRDKDFTSSADQAL